MRYFLLFQLLISASAIAQSDDQLEKIAQGTCDCINQKNTDLTNKSQTEMALGLCILNAAKDGGLALDFANTKAMEELGKTVGIRMVTKCPNVFQSFINEEESDSGEQEYVDVTGKVRAIEFSDFTTIVLVEDSGKEHRLVWLHYFTGSDAFVDDPKLMIGKSFVVTYSLTEIYTPKQKSYLPYKQISGLEVK
jgi:hypothetical protein